MKLTFELVDQRRYDTPWDWEILSTSAGLGGSGVKGVREAHQWSTLGQEKKTPFVQGNNNVRVRIWRDKQTKTLEIKGRLQNIRG